jgi:hypothetical protein
MILLLAGMTVYELERRWHKALPPRFRLIHFALAILLVELFVIAYTTEVKQVSKRVLELATGSTPTQLEEAPKAPAIGP